MSATLPEPVLRVRHDSWTRLLYLQLGAFAFFLYAFNPSIALLKDDLHLSAGIAGLHSTCYALGVTAAGTVAPWYIRRAGGSRPAVWLGLLGLSLSVALFCAVPSLSVTLPAAAICGVFGSWLCIAIPAALSRAHGPETGPAAITEANAVAAFVGIAAPLAVGGADAAGLGWRTALLTFAPLCAVLYVVLGRVREPEWCADEPEAAAAAAAGVVGEAVEAYGLGAAVPEPVEQVLAPSGVGTRVSVQAAIPAPRTEFDLPAAPAAPSATVRDLPRRFWLNQIAGVCAGAIEFCLTLWCATLLRDRAHLSAGVAATGVTAVVAGMAMGRAVGGRLALRISIDRLIFAAFAVNLIGFALFWSTPNPFLMFAGLAVAGLGVSLQYPLLAARGIEMSGGEAELAGAVNMFGGGIAVATAPFALGFLSDSVGIHTAYLLLPAFIVAAVLAVAASGRRSGAEA